MQLVTACNNFARATFLLLAPVLCASLGHAEIDYRGVNLSAAAFGHYSDSDASLNHFPGVYGTDYIYPQDSYFDYFHSLGMNRFRIPFRWERIQPTLSGELDAAEYRRLADAVHQATAKKLFVILDVHNYAAYRNAPIGSPDVPVAAFADLWKRLAARFKTKTQVGFGLMNEPKGLPTETWLAAANAALAQIRAAGAKNLVFVPGNGWTGAHSWFGKSYGTPNAAGVVGINDPADNYVYELHQYLDSNSSGTHPQCKSESVGVAALTAITEWLRQHHKRGFLGEFGVPGKPRCIAALKSMVDVIEENKDVWTGWSYWAAGDWWPETEALNIQPTKNGDRPQLAGLMPALSDFSAEGKMCPSLNAGG